VAENSAKFGDIKNREASLTSSLSGLIRGKWMVKVGESVLYEEESYNDILKTNPYKLFEWKVQLLNPPKLILKEDSSDISNQKVFFTSNDGNVLGHLYFYYNIGDTIATTDDVPVQDIEKHAKVWRINDPALNISGNKIIKARALLLNKDVSDSIWAWGTSVSAQKVLEIAHIMKPEIFPKSQVIQSTLTVTLSQPQGYDIYYKIDNASIIKYSGPFNLTDSATVTAYSEIEINSHKVRSESVSETYEVCSDSQKIELNVCVEKTCEDDGFDCPVCSATEVLVYDYAGKGFCKSTSANTISSRVCALEYDGFGYQIDTNGYSNDTTYISCLYGFDKKLDWQTPYRGGKKDGVALGFGLYVEGELYRKIVYKNDVVLSDCWYTPTGNQCN
jgi:hypothetical protein